MKRHPFKCTQICGWAKLSKAPLNLTLPLLDLRLPIDDDGDVTWGLPTGSPSPPPPTQLDACPQPQLDPPHLQFIYIAYICIYNICIYNICIYNICIYCDSQLDPPHLHLFLVGPHPTGIGNFPQPGQQDNNDPVGEDNNDHPEKDRDENCCVSYLWRRFKTYSSSHHFRLLKSLLLCPPWRTGIAHLFPLFLCLFHYFSSTFCYVWSNVSLTHLQI